VCVYTCLEGTATLYSNTNLSDQSHVCHCGFLEEASVFFTTKLNRDIFTRLKRLAYKSLSALCLQGGLMLWSVW